MLCQTLRAEQPFHRCGHARRRLASTDDHDPVNAVELQWWKKRLSVKEQPPVASE